MYQDSNNETHERERNARGGVELSDNYVSAAESRRAASSVWKRAITKGKAAGKALEP
jgi:hypothetical protein